MIPVLLALSGWVLGQTPLPSKPGPHLEKVQAMGRNEWLSLGKPAPDATYGAAPGRAYTNKMAAAPDLGGAFLFGEGVHGASKDIGGKTYYNDDVFFYDLVAHRWVCIYPGTEIEAFTRTLDANGFEATDDGQNTPIAAAVHGYECFTYDPDRKVFMLLETGSPYSGKLKERRATWLKGAPAGQDLGKHPFVFDVKTGRWQRRKVEGRGPDPRFCKTLEYIPSRKQTLYYARGNGLWWYDFDANGWTFSQGQGPAPERVKEGGILEGTTCYDSKRDRLYVFTNGQVSIPWIYDVKTNTFSDSKAARQPGTAGDFAQGKRNLSSTSSNVHYDAVNDVVVLRFNISKGSGDPRNIPSQAMGLAIYDPKTNAWREEFVPLAQDMPRASWNSYYDPVRNVHVFHLARDSSRDGKIWLYRYGRGD